MEEKKRPICKVRSKSTILSVWDNHNSKLETWETIQLERIYKDKEDNWKSSNIFRPSDIDDLIQVLEEFKKQKNLVIITPYKKEEQK